MEMARMKELVRELSKASRAYHGGGDAAMSDKEYDRLLDELAELESRLGIVMAGSPTQKVGHDAVSQLAEAAHETPLLSLDKTKSKEALAKFLGGHEGLLSWKLDGLNLSLRYAGGALAQAITRGNGRVGEDITHNAKAMKNVPLVVPHKESFTVNGEAVISYADFAEINEREGGRYKNPRNLVSGTMRLLSPEVSAARPAGFHAIGAFGELPDSFGKKSQRLDWLAGQGFDVCERRIVDAASLPEAVADFEGRAAGYWLATDGLVLTFNDTAYSARLGATSKFPRDSIAFKWADETQETALEKIEWNTSRTGLVNPVAVFEPVDIDGTQVGRAALHNVSILKALDLRPGDRITVYKANMIIPQVDENLSRAGAPRGVAIPAECPACGGETAVVGEPETLVCQNGACPAKATGGLAHFVGRDALNIQGLSESTIAKLAQEGIVSVYVDFFTLGRHRDRLERMEGLGKKSAAKLLSAIEAAKTVRLENFIYALGIRHIGLSGAKLLCGHFGHSPRGLADACAGDGYAEALGEIRGFGKELAKSLHEYFGDAGNMARYNEALGHLKFAEPDRGGGGALGGLCFAITGDVRGFGNRKEMRDFIESRGGRVATGVSAKTDYLVNNDKGGSSSKNKKAAALGVKVIDEDELMALAEM